MPHELSSVDASRLVLRRQAAWHGLGNVIEDDLTAVQAGERFNFFDPIDDWSLAAYSAAGLQALNEMQSAIAAGNFLAAIDAMEVMQRESLSVDSHKANVQVEAGRNNLLGIVGSNYRTCQNRELAEFTDALAQAGNVVIETAGTIQDGRRIFFLARGESFNVEGTDKVWPYILVSNAHDGTSAVRVTPTTVRVVCSNTLHMVIPRNDEHMTQCDKAAITIRHSGNLQSKLEDAKIALRHYNNVLETNQALFNRLSQMEMSRDKALEFFAGAYTHLGWEIPTSEELASSDERIRSLAERRERKMQRAAEDFITRWNREQEVARPSAWLAMNAMTGVLQHDIVSAGADDERRVERRIRSNLFGIGADRAQEVLAMALNS